jgi:hypothetical protein
VRLLRLKVAPIHIVRRLSTRAAHGEDDSGFVERSEVRRPPGWRRTGRTLGRSRPILSAI